MNLKTSNIKLIIGLGNPGKKYSKTFHNSGFLFIDFLRDNLKDDFQISNKKEYELTTFSNQDLKLLKPLAYMNNSGNVVAEFLKYNDYKPEEILIALDDLDINFGEYKLQHAKFPKSHNGINSIHKSTGETDYNYLRIGIETRDTRRKHLQSGEDYVLSKMDRKRKKILEEVFSDILSELMEILEIA